MTEAVQIKIEDQELKEFECRLGATANALPKVVSRGINRTADQGRTLISRRLREQMKLRDRDIKARLTIAPRATYGRWLSRINIGTGGIPVLGFGARQTAAGVTWAPPLAMGLRALIPHAFKATMPSGHTGIFIREEKGKDRHPRRIRVGEISELAELVKRSPILAVIGPSLAEAYFNVGGLAASCEKEVAGKLIPNINDQIYLILAGKRT